MCSKAGQPELTMPAGSGLAARLTAAIDEVAAAAQAASDGADAILADRLAGAWAMITAADPELAARTASYCRSAAPESRS